LSTLTKKGISSRKLRDLEKLKLSGLSITSKKGRKAPILTSSRNEDKTISINNK
jgi:hypothetical protein